LENPEEHNEEIELSIFTNREPDNQDVQNIVEAIRQNERHALENHEEQKREDSESLSNISDERNPEEI